MKKRQVTRFHLHAEYRKEHKQANIALWILLIVGFLCFLASCTTHRYDMRPNLNYLTEDNQGILICRYDAQGGKICEHNLSYFGNKRIYAVPTEGWVKE